MKWIVESNFWRSLRSAWSFRLLATAPASSSAPDALRSPEVAREIDRLRVRRKLRRAVAAERRRQVRCLMAKIAELDCSHSERDPNAALIRSLIWAEKQRERG